MADLAAGGRAARPRGARRRAHRHLRRLRRRRRELHGAARRLPAPVRGAGAAAGGAPRRGLRVSGEPGARARRAGLPRAGAGRLRHRRPAGGEPGRRRRDRRDRRRPPSCRRVALAGPGAHQPAPPRLRYPYKGLASVGLCFYFAPACAASSRAPGRQVPDPAPAPRSGGARHRGRRGAARRREPHPGGARPGAARRHAAAGAARALAPLQPRPARCRAATISAGGSGRASTRPAGWATRPWPCAASARASPRWPWPRRGSATRRTSAARRSRRGSSRRRSPRPRRRPERVSAACWSPARAGTRA